MMNEGRNKKIYKKVKQKGLDFQVVCEVGVYLPETSNIIDFIYEGKKTILVEPNPPAIEAIKSYFKDFSNIVLFPFAIYKNNGKLKLSNAEASTFVSELKSSPALINDKYVKEPSREVEVECRIFGEIDEGNIELLSIDTEGCEWYVLETMKSRPKVISIETHGKFYVNPFIDNIKNWMAQNHYKIWFKDKSDTVYYKDELFKLSFKEKLQNILMGIYLTIRREKKIFYKR